MDAWYRTFDQLRTVFRGLSVAQRLSVLVVTIGVLGGIGWLAVTAAGPRDEFLLGGKNFTPEELQRTQSALQAAGLTQARTVGQKISVPSADADRYTAAALAQQTLPAQFAAEFDRMQSKVNVFTSSEQRRELLEEARKTRLAQILRAIPEIEEAVVEWDRPKTVNLFRPAPQIAAHVSVKPRQGRELSLELVQSLKLFVAGALAGAQTDDVTVVDMNTSRVYGRSTAESTASQQNAGLAKQQTADYALRLQQALRYIPEVLVEVNLEILPEEGTSGPDVERSRSFVGAEIVPVRHRVARGIGIARSNQPLSNDAEPETATDQLRDIDAATEWSDSRTVPDGDTRVESRSTATRRTSVQVLVSIPEDYYAAVAQSRGLSPGQNLVQDSAYRAELASIKAETQRDVREKLAHLLPRGGSVADIAVTTYVPLNGPAHRNGPSKQRRKSVVTRTLPGFDFSYEALQANWQWTTGIAICSLCGLWVVARLGRSGRRRTSRSSGSPAATIASTSLALATESGSEDIAADDEDLENPEPQEPHAAVLGKLAELERHGPAVTRPRDNPFEFLAELSVVDAVQLLESEHPQTIALVATALAPALAANVLHALPDSLRWDVTQRLARMGTAAPDVLQEVAASLQARHHQPSMEGRPAVAPLVAHFPQTNPTGESPTPLASNSSGCPVAFADLLRLSTRELTGVLEAVDLRSCAVALMDQSEAFKQSLLAKLPKAVATSIRQHLKRPGPVRLAAISAAQQEIAEVAWHLTQQGVIHLPARRSEVA